MSDRHVYHQTMKVFGPQAEPAFEDPLYQQAEWGRAWGCDNDVGQIRAVLVHRPGAEFSVIDPSKKINSIGSYGDPETGWYWQSTSIPPLEQLQAQHDALTAALKAEGAEVIPVEGVTGHRFKSCYTRDSAVAVKGGAIVTRLAPRMRKGEEKAVTRTLASHGVPILHTVHGTGLMEGGSFAWLNARTAVIGHSIRVNDDGIAQIGEVLKRQGVDLIVVDLCGYEIHIDGMFLMIDVDLALVNAARLPHRFLQTLKDLKIHTIETVPEDNDWIINGLAVRPGRVLMSGGMSERTREELERHKVEIVELPYDAMQLNGGGIHCSTCPLIRDAV